jgi:hypothetical protein
VHIFYEYRFPEQLISRVKLGFFYFNVISGSLASFVDVIVLFLSCVVDLVLGFS